MTAIICGGVAFVFIALVAWSLCVAAGRADEQMARMFGARK